MRILIDHAIITDANGTKAGKILIEDRKIKKIYKENAKVRAKYDRLIDAEGMTVMPGMIDTHCHLRDPGLTWKEDLESGLKAAAKGGFTTVCAMANTKPVCDSEAVLSDVLERSKALGLTEVIQACALTKEFGPDEMADFESTRPLTQIYSNDGHTVEPAERMRDGLIASKDYGFILMAHEDPESKTVARDIELLRENGGHLHICHISKKETLDLIKNAKEEGLDITCEVTPHHLYASGLQYRVHPPFRTWADRSALIEGIRDGSIDCFGTDHAPHSEEDKRKGAPGLVNFETAFGMYHTVLMKNNIPLERFSEAASFTPAKRLGLHAGLVQEGYPADLIFVRPEEEWKIVPKQFVSKSVNTPFASDWLTGRVHKTMKNGKLIYDADRQDPFTDDFVLEEPKGENA